MNRRNRLILAVAVVGAGLYYWNYKRAGGDTTTHPFPAAIEGGWLTVVPVLGVAAAVGWFI